MMRGAGIVLTLVIFLSGCAAKRTQKELIGSWHNIQFRVDINKTAPPEESRGVFEVTPTEWESKLKLSRIITRFDETGTYVSDHFNPGDSLLFSVSGNWSVVGDSLTFDQLQPRNSKTTFHFTILADTARFAGLLDWDGDGKADDFYSGKQIRKRK